jgi:hypothetical protein
MRKNITYIVLLYLLPGCISAYEASEVEDMSGLLVVEGVILEEGTKITLSRTVRLDETLSQSYLFDKVNNATIHIIDEANNVIAVAEQDGWGEYIVKERFSFVAGMKYALDIDVFWGHYQSAFVEPVETPAIDEVNWKLNDDNSIDILVSTHNPVNETLYCLWDFEEAWEIRSRYFADRRYDPANGIIQQSLSDNSNRYYCWASDYSKSLLMASSEKNREATIKDHRIITLQPGNSRYSYLYSINVRQFRLSKEAYQYFNHLQRNIDESGSLFAPQPSEVKGNIQCLSHPDETVIGYIFASKAVTSRLFIPMAEQNLTNFEGLGFCDEKSFETPQIAYGQGYGISGGNNYVTLRCVDCMQRTAMATKTKPGFWPNEHQ